MQAASITVRATITAEYSNPDPPATRSADIECSCGIPAGSPAVSDESGLDMSVIAAALRVTFEQATGSEFAVTVSSADRDVLHDLQASSARIQLPWWHLSHETSWEVTSASMLSGAEQ